VTDLTPEEREKIFQEEKARHEAKKQFETESKEAEVSANTKKAGKGCLILIGVIVVVILLIILGPKKNGTVKQLEQIRVNIIRENKFENGQQDYIFRATNTSKKIFTGDITFTAVDETDNHIDNEYFTIENLKSGAVTSVEGSFKEPARITNVKYEVSGSFEPVSKP
jgi:hypothetical protein